MPMIVFNHKGDFKNTENFFKRAVTSDYVSMLERCARDGVEALASATPVDSGETASSWGYEIKHDSRGVSITWINSNIVDGVPIAVILQYGHATRNGGYVQGRDYINPAIKPIFDKIANDVWREATRL
jgi:hypothetical protein